MNYYVVTLEHVDPLTKKSKFLYLGQDLVDETMERVRIKLQNTGDSSFLNELENAEVYTFSECAPGYEQKLPELAKGRLPTAEYEKFRKVYFLNESALRMYKEGGVEFEVAKIISDDELPEDCHRTLSSHYLSKEK